VTTGYLAIGASGSQSNALSYNSPPLAVAGPQAPRIVHQACVASPIKFNLVT